MEMLRSRQAMFKWTVFIVAFAQFLARTVYVQDGTISYSVKFSQTHLCHQRQSPVSPFHLYLDLRVPHRYSKKQFYFYKAGYTTRVTLLLLIAGDVNPNPGPVNDLKYPCKSCNKAARWGQECIECEQCGSWFHAYCIGLSSNIFKALAKHPSYSWICCNCGLPNFSSSLLESKVKTKNSFDSLLDTMDMSDIVGSISSGCDIGSPTRASSPIKATQATLKASCKPRTKTKTIKIVNVNCQSIRSKLAGYLHFSEEEDPDVIVGTESWLNPSITNGEIFPTNFQVFRKDRTGSSDSHGGVFIAINDRLIAQDESNLDQPDCELKWISLQVKGIAPVFIGAFYRSQKTDTDYLRSLDNSLRQIPTNASVWLLGDFNLPDINWDTCSFIPGGRYPAHSKLMLDLAQDYNLHQIVREPTRENNILDLCFTNDPSFLIKARVTPGISDHDAVVITASIKPKLVHKPKRSVYLYAKGDSEKIEQDLEAFNEQLSEDYIQTSDIDSLWTGFTQVIKTSMDKYIPTKMCSSKVKLPWMTDRLRRACNKKRKLYDKARRTGDFELWDKFKETRRKLDRNLRNLRRDYLSNICNSLKTNNTKPFWRYIKSIYDERFLVLAPSSILVVSHPVPKRKLKFLMPSSVQYLQKKIYRMFQP